MKENSTYQETALLKSVSQGDETAYARLFHAYRNKLYAFIYQLSGSAGMAEDVLQEVFLKIWRDRQGLTEIDNFNAYLYRMAQNHAINVLRRQSRETLILAEIKRISPEAQSETDPLSAKEIQTLLQHALGNLPAQQRRVYELGRAQGLKYEEIAAELNISVSTVRNHMVQALKAIRAYIRTAYPGMIITFPLVLLLP